MIIASFAEFLNTGRLGPMVPGMALNDVALAFGPPAQWLKGGMLPAGPVPGYWRYRRHLEVSFDFEERPHCDWFQLEYGRSLAGQAAQVCDKMVMVLDGLTGTSPVSAYISAIADIDHVRVRLVDKAGYPGPRVYVDDIEIIFNCDDELFRREMTEAEQVGFVEAGSELDSIYSFHRSQHRLNWLAREPKHDEPELLSGRDYLRLCRA